jgi:ABC-2 type transport system permease protein
VVLLALPVVQVVLFGFAIRTDVNDVRLAIVDPAPDRATIELRNRFASSGLFRTVAVVSRTSDLDPLFETGAAQQAVVFEAGFANDLGSGEPAHILIISDTTEPNTGNLVQAYALAVIDGYQRELGLPRRSARVLRGAEAGSALPGANAGLPRRSASVLPGAEAGAKAGVAIVPDVRMRFNPTRESSNLFVPGLMAFVLTIISSLMTAISLTREKETGTMEALLVSPLRPWEIIVGKVAPYLVIGFISVIAVLVEARLVFRVPLRGSVALLLFEGGLYILVSLSLGILISARTSSQRVAMMGALLGTMLPNVLLSGFIFPVESMPAALRIVSYAVPGRWFVLIARGIMLKGVGLEYLWLETLILAAMAAVLLAASTRSFKERLE